MNKKYVVREDKCDMTTFNEVVRSENYQEFIFGQNDVLLDLGGNTGYLVVKYHDKVKQIITVEPDKDNIEIIQDNIKLNNISNTIVIDKAVVHDDKKQISFYIVNGKSTSMNSIFKTRGRKEVTVGCVNINYLIETYNPTHIKIDIEGAELDVLNNIKTENFKNIKQIIFEYHFSILKDKNKEQFCQLIENLKSIFSEVKYQDKEKYFGGATIVVCNK